VINEERYLTHRFIGHSSPCFRLNLMTTIKLGHFRFLLVADRTAFMSVRFVQEADLRYYSEEEAQKYLGLLGNNYDI